MAAAMPALIVRTIWRTCPWGLRKEKEEEKKKKEEEASVKTKKKRRAHFFAHERRGAISTV